MKAQCSHRIAILTGFLVLLPLILDGAQAPTGRLRIITPQDGTIVEPGQSFAVAVEPERGITPASIALISNPIFTVQERPPFSFSVSYPVDIPLGPKRLTADGRDTRNRPLTAEITLHVETTTPVKSIQVEPAKLNFFTSWQNSLSVEGTFSDGQVRDVTKSRETTYVLSNPQVVTISRNGLVEVLDNGTTTITITYKDKTVTVPVKVTFKKLTIPIKIRPESPRNEVNLTSKGRLPVVIFSTKDFNATRVVPETVRFGPGRARPLPEGDDDQDDDRDDREERERERRKIGKIEDINGDGLPDLLLHFRIQEIGLTCADKQATLTGFNLRGERITGTDTVLPSGPGCR